MGLIPQDVIDQVLAAYDIVEVVGGRVPLKQAGRSFKALCPFHEEKTPSFTVNPDRQTFKCFGCGKGGNVFQFLMEHEGVTFPEAVRQLARDRGIAVPDVQNRTPEEEGRVERARKALAAAQAFYVRCLAADEGREARAYLTKRGYDAEAVKTFGLGYAPAGWDRLLQAARKRGVSGAVLEDAGLALERKEGGHYDRFRHRVVFPITDLQGRVITFGARALSDEDNPKYLNGPETVVFKKAAVLYALDRARDGIRRTGEALLMEGYTDVLTCHLHGVDRAIAGMGTAFTPQQARLLKRFARRVVLVYDGDEAGRMAAERTLDILLPEGLDVAVVLLPEDRDVDEILLEEGPEALEARVADALDLLAFKREVLSHRFDLKTPRGMAEAAESLAETIMKVPSPVARDELLRVAAQSLGDVHTEKPLRDVAAGLLARAERSVRPRRAQQDAINGSGHGSGPRGTEETVADRKRLEAEEFLLAGYLLFPELKEQIARAVGPEDFETPVLRRIYKAALELHEAGEACDPRALAARLARDVEAQAALAGLPEDPTLEERIPFQIEYLERLRRTRRRALEIRRELGGSDPALDTRSDVRSDARSDDQTSVDGSQCGDRSEGTAPREQVG